MSDELELEIPEDAGGPVVNPELEIPEDAGGPVVVDPELEIPEDAGGHIKIIKETGNLEYGYTRTVRTFGERNHLKTCLTGDILSENCVLVAGGAKSIARKLATKKGILATAANGNAIFIEVPSGIAGQNKILATDASGNLIWIDR